MFRHPLIKGTSELEDIKVKEELERLEMFTTSIHNVSQLPEEMYNVEN